MLELLTRECIFKEKVRVLARAELKRTQGTQKLWPNKNNDPQ